jgi:hypothetical protein
MVSLSRMPRRRIIFADALAETAFPHSGDFRSSSSARATPSSPTSAKIRVPKPSACSKDRGRKPRQHRRAPLQRAVDGGGLARCRQRRRNATLESRRRRGPCSSVVGLRAIPTRPKWPRPNQARRRIIHSVPFCLSFFILVTSRAAKARSLAALRAISPGIRHTAPVALRRPAFETRLANLILSKPIPIPDVAH